MLDERVSTSRSIARIVAGLDTPDSGSCTIGKAQTAASMPESRRRIGYVPNPPVVLRGMKLSNFLLLSARAYRRSGSAREDERSTIDQVVQWCDLSTDLDTTLEKLGRQKLYMAGFAAALLHHPLVLVLEGPLPQPVSSLLPSLREAGKAVLSTAIAISEIPVTADRIGLCDQSGIRVTTTTQDLLEACRKLSTIEVSFQPTLARDQIEALPSVQQVTQTPTGFRLGVASIESTLVAIANTARANARRIVELSMSPPSVDQLINYFDYLRFPDEGSLFSSTPDSGGN
jgi:ABC-type multidrug transport system ATPase subunit